MKGGGGKRRRPSPLDHPWSLTPKEARELQLSLRGRLRFPLLGRPPRTVAGADISHLRFGRRAVAGVVVLSFPDLEVIEESLAVGEASFPYVPGLLSFREGPLLERAFGGLSRMPDLIFFDGQGIAHPRRLGVASHLGLRLGVPSVGCAKSWLWGEAHGTGRGKRGMGTSESARRRGRGKRSSGHEKESSPFYVSPGHRIDLEGTIRYTLAVSPRYRIPVPIRAAHIRTNEGRRRLGIV